MKTRQVIALSILAMAGLASCEKHDLYDPSQKETTIEDLAISPDFEWTMMKSVTCNITSNAPAKAGIYLDEACSSSNLLASVAVTQDQPLTLPLSVLSSNQEVYVKYAEGIKPLIVPIKANGQIDVVIPEKIRSKANSDDFYQQGNVIYYPSSGSGMVMFEDNYPDKGDYDFNDFVASYIVEIVTIPGSSKVEKINFSMQVRAIGGIKHFIPHLRLKAVPFESVKNLVVEKGEIENLNVVLEKDSKNAVVLAFNGAEDKKGKEFLNTLEGEGAMYPMKFTVSIEFDKENQNTLPDMAYIYIEMFDIFLATSNHDQEIHMLGYGPAFSDNAVDYEKTDYYKMPETNLVWGLNLPKVVDHAYERANFLKAYPNFKDWVTGDTANKWYDHGDATYLFKIFK